MPCCVTLLKSLQYAESNAESSFDDEEDVVDTEVVEKFYKNRPRRTGIYFLCHRENLTEIMEIAGDCLIGEPVSIWEDFFKFHPVRHPLCQEFVSLCVRPEFVEKHPEFVNMASYRWLDVQGVGDSGKGYSAPTNYVWFLEWLKKDVRVGWMDFMANIVVNVATEETVAYMGNFYARLPTIAQWMLDPDLLGSALNRAWIYQETAFGAFASEGIDIVLDDIRSLGLSLCSSSCNHAVIEKFELCRKFCRRAEHMAKLLDRRGYFSFATKQEILKERQYAYYQDAPYYNMDGKVTDMVLTRAFEGEEVDYEFRQEIHGIIQSGYSKGYTAMYHICEFFTAPTDDEEFPIVYKSIHKLCTMRTWEDCNTAEEFFEQIGDPLLAAYSALDVSYESDREPSVSKVALSIMERDYENSMGYHDFCQAVWRGSADMCLKTSEESSDGLGLVSSSKIAFQHCISSGKRFLGGVRVSGALVDSNGAYATANGGRSTESHWILSLVTGFGEDFQYDEDKEAWIKEEDGVERSFDIYFCNGPTKTNYFCSIVCVLHEENDERRPFCAWFYTSRAVPDFPKPAEEIEVF